MYCNFIATDWGWTGIAGRQAIGALVFALPTQDQARASLVEILRDRGVNEDLEEDQGFYPEALEACWRYFHGQQVEFPYPIDWSFYTPFQAQVLEVTRSIAYGDISTYAQIAQAVGRPQAFRAVGGAEGRNLVPIIIPCHRVVATRGGLGGYRLGLEMKARLLRLEASPKGSMEVAQAQE